MLRTTRDDDANRCGDAHGHREEQAKRNEQAKRDEQRRAAPLLGPEQRNMKLNGRVRRPAGARRGHARAAAEAAALLALLRWCRAARPHNVALGPGQRRPDADQSLSVT